ncbi:hypothetical protein ABZ897_53835 [Nonomuraea sp. NPDC046802]|uniref:hypothetical protein n=1 Tax=Nonomuraea sp. NPDC046802 TaxID=3154919 RepID=UPI00340BEDBD
MMVTRVLSKMGWKVLPPEKASEHGSTFVDLAAGLVETVLLGQESELFADATFVDVIGGVVHEVGEDVGIQVAVFGVADQAVRTGQPC